MENEREICRKAIDTWGAKEQLTATMEELAELIVALNHYRRGRLGSLHEVMEEMSDVEIMLTQVKEIVLKIDALIPEDRARSYGLMKRRKLVKLKQKLLSGKY